MSEARVVAFVPLAGRAEWHAALVRVDGVPLLVHAVRRVVDSGSVDRIVVVAPESEMDGELTELLADFGVPVDGVVHAVPVSFAPAVRVVLVHDPLRAFTPPSLIRRVVEAVLVADTPVVPVLPCSDTVKLLDDHRVVIDTPDRAGLRVVQTPLGYPARLIGSGAVVAGDVPPGAHTVPGDPAARRLAGPVALAMAVGGAT
jgi:2-C-methyl-D-erythritol 4-phosphate cytidylyltransferase